MIRVLRRNDSKSKDVFHPYNTRSSRKHQKKKNYIQLKDNTRNRNKNPPPKDKYNTSTSVPGSSKGKPAARVGPAKKVPRTLYNCIQAALAARKDWEAKRDKPSELELQFAENLVNSSAYYYKYIDRVLPPNWKYNPATASTLVSKDDLPLLTLIEKPEKKMKTKTCEDSDSDSDSDSNSDSDLDPSIKFPKVRDVPLKEDDIESWLQFKKFDEGYPTSVPGLEPGQIKFPVNIEHPFVSVIGYFAVNGFNESFEMFVKKGECNHLRDPVFKEFTYCNFGGLFFFYMIIEANEDGIRGIYKAKVRCTLNGMRTLLKFSLIEETYGMRLFRVSFVLMWVSLTDKNPQVEIYARYYAATNMRLFMQQYDKKELVYNAFKNGFKIVKDAHIPYYSGMKRRMNAMGSTCGYNYFNPSEEMD